MLGNIRVRCCECGHWFSCEVFFPKNNEPFESTCVACPNCGTLLMVKDHHEYSKDGTIKED